MMQSRARRGSAKDPVIGLWLLTLSLLAPRAVLSQEPSPFAGRVVLAGTGTPAEVVTQAITLISDFLSSKGVPVVLESQATDKNRGLAAAMGNTAGDSAEVVLERLKSSGMVSLVFLTVKTEYPGEPAMWSGRITATAFDANGERLWEDYITRRISSSIPDMIKKLIERKFTPRVGKAGLPVR